MTPESIALAPLVPIIAEPCVTDDDLALAGGLAARGPSWFSLKPNRCC
jgi:hypothetical protein